VEEALTEVGAGEELVVLLDSHRREYASAMSAAVKSRPERGQQDPWLLAASRDDDDADAQGLHVAHRRAVRRDEVDHALRAAGRQELLDPLEGARRGHADDEVEAAQGETDRTSKAG